MRNTNGFLAVTTLALLSAFMIAPGALACGSCNRAVITQPAVIESSAPVVLSQPAVVTTTPVMTTDTFMLAPVRRHHHLLRIDTPIGGLRLF